MLPRTTGFTLTAADVQFARDRERKHTPGAQLLAFPRVHIGSKPTGTEVLARRTAKPCFESAQLSDLRGSFEFLKLVSDAILSENARQLARTAIALRQGALIVLHPAAEFS